MDNPDRGSVPSGTDTLLAEMSKRGHPQAIINAVSKSLDAPPTKRELIDFAYNQARINILIGNTLVALAANDSKEVIPALDELLPKITDDVAFIGKVFGETVWQVSRDISGHVDD